MPRKECQNSNICTCSHTSLTNPQVLNLSNYRYMYYQYSGRERVKNEVLPSYPKIGLSWIITGYDQFLENVGTWSCTLGVGKSDTDFLPLRVKIDLTNYPESYPGLKISLNDDLFEYYDQETVDAFKERFNEILGQIPFIDTEGNVDNDELKISYIVEDPDEEDQEPIEAEEEDPVPPLAHILNFIGACIFAKMY